jgi:hypothetical protein
MEYMTTSLTGSITVGTDLRRVNNRRCTVPFTITQAIDPNGTNVLSPGQTITLGVEYDTATAATIWPSGTQITFAITAVTPIGQ